MRIHLSIPRSTPLLLSLLGTLVPALEAGAQTVALTCPIAATTTYQPGATFTPQTTFNQSRVNFGPCANPTRPMESPSGTITLTGLGTTSCYSGDANVSGTFTWDDGTTSAATLVVHREAAVEIYSGIIRSGRYEGTRLSVALTLTTIDFMSCLVVPGLTTIAGSGTMFMIPMGM
ncbi:hypothetical protein LZ198_42270 [Myxococcus sp. K15C18031901]|uniref:hypothetical protein n=1 Tax=Myxococcus dinghuensis TaxID=2906761 RepID=UPI0020A72074|nr:hypothetical protein [Myxococcus dinghuensis]MCP3105502.1 hypothetical protein [Myxococcus dinghuensis]